MKKLLLLVLVVIQLSAYAQFPNGINAAQLPTTNGMILALIDYNNDGFTDVVYQNGLGGNIQIYSNNNGVFSNATSQLGFPTIAGNGLGTEGVVKLDYNNDGFSDLLLAQSGANGNMRLFRNNCGQSFTEVSGAMNMPTNTNIVAQYQSLNPIILISDVDKDNDNDILFGRFIGGQYHISLLRNNGSNFGSAVNIISGFGSSAQPNFALIDFDNDRDEDLLVVSNTGNASAGVVSLFENNGSGLYSFFSGTTGITNSSPIGFAQIFDYNNDGFQDILLGSKDTLQPTPSTFSLKVYRNTNGTGAFSDQSSNFNTQSSLLGDYFNAHTFDFNNDGLTDILWEIKNTGGTSSRPALMRFNGGSSFTETQNTFIFSAITDVNVTANYVVFDYNNDGKMDIFQPGGGSQANARLFRNNTSGNNYIGFSLRSCNGQTDPLGARMYVKFGANTVHKTYTGQTNNSNQAYALDKVYFGLGSANRIDSLVVFWPNGNVTRMGQMGANQQINLSDGSCNLGQTAQISFASDSLSFCNTPSTVINAPAGYSSYVWSNNETTQGITVTETNWYKCTVSQANGCQASDSIFVALGNADIIQNDTTIIVGQSITLDATPRNDCGPLGAPLNVVVNANDNLSPELQYVGSLNGHHYYLFNNPSSWTEAETKALALGGQLVSINSQEENDFITNDPLLSNVNLWIGLYRENNPGDNFNWVNCSPLSYTNWSTGTASPTLNPDEQFGYLVSNGCPDAGQWKNINESIVSPDPCQSNIRGLVEFDNGDNLSYLWNTAQTTPSITVSPTSTRTYIVQVNQNNAICSANVTVTVMQPSSIIDQDSLIECKASSALITAKTGWDTYTWNTSETTRNITVTQSGWYKVTATFGASMATDSIYVSLNNVQIKTADTTICAGSTLQIFGPNPPFSIQTQYTQNFTTLPYTNWSSANNINYNGSRVLGPFANDSINFNLGALPNHDSLTVTFDLYIHDTWEGDCSLVGSDRFRLKNGNQAILDASFSNNVGCTQSYNSNGIAGSYAAKTSATQSNLPLRCNLNGTTTKYTITRTFAHSTASLALSFIGDLKDTADNSSLCDESWSIDNIQIQVRKLDKVLWSTGDTLQNITVSPTNPSNSYWVRVPIPGGFCYDTITVNTQSGAQAGNLFSTDSISVCNQYSVSLSLPDGYDVYTWSSGAQTKNATLYNNGWYKASVSTTLGTCAASDSIYVNINNFGLTFTDTTICKNSVLELSADLNNNTTPFEGPAVTSYSPAQVIAGYSYLGEYHGHYYYQANTRSRWTMAAQNALNAGGHLAIINDTLEQRFIEERIDSNAWIGLFKSSAGYFEWMNGDTLVYNNWAAGQPSATPNDYVFMPGKACGSRQWKSHTDSDTLSTLPCQSNMYGILEIYPVTYSYLWTNTEFTKNNFINPQGDTLMALQVTKNENGHITTCQAGVADVKVIAEPLVTGSTKICNSDIEVYTTPARSGSTYSWIVLGGNIVSGQNTNTVSVSWNTPGFGGIEVIDSVLSIGCVNRSGFIAVDVSLFAEPNITGDTIVCENSTAIYHVAADTSYIYNWSVTGGSIANGQGTDSITVAWNTSGVGTVNIEVSDKWTGCSGNAKELEIDILANPISMVSGSDTACENSIASYSTTAVLGHVYTWQVSNGMVATGQGTPNVNIIWGNSGSGSITLVDSNTTTGCKGSSAPFNVVLEVTPDPIVTGNTDVCSNTTHTYSTPSALGHAYDWTISNGTIVSGQGTASISVLWDAAGTGTLQVRDSILATGCRAISDLLIININDLPTPIVSGSSSVCENTNAVYTTPSNTGRTYRWSVTGGSIASGQGTASVIVTWNSPGTGTLSVNDSINASGCNASSTPLNIFINPKPNPSIVGNNTACVGGNSVYSITAGSNNSYVWTVTNGIIVSGQGSNSVTINWNNVGTGTVQVSDSNTLSSCVGISNVLNVSVSSINNPDISGTIEVCSGSVETYSIPSNLNRSYTWDVVGGSIVSGQGTSSISVFWPSIGSGSLSVRDSNQVSGCVAISNPFNVNISNFDLPVVIGPSSVCLGTEATYSTPFNGGRTYRWNVSGGVIVSGQGTFSIVVAWGFLGAGSVSVFDSVDASGCNGTSLPTLVTITDKPNALISGANSLCADAVSNYGTIPGANKFYTWGVLGGTILSGQGTSMATINWDVPGTGYVFLYDSLIGSSCAAYAVKEVAVNPNPSAAFTTSQSMGGITLTPAEPNLQAKWYFGDGDSSTQYAPTHFYASNGTYSINFIAKTLKGCTNTSSTDVNISTVSIAKYLANGSINFTAYPNPFMGATTVSLSLSETAEIGIDLFDMSGRLVKTLAEPNMKTAGDYEYAVMSGDLNSQNGMYLVRLKLNDQYHYLKIVEMGK